MEKKTLMDKIVVQKAELKLYINKCIDWFPTFICDILNSNKTLSSKVIKGHLSERISNQTEMWASLRSCWSYFDRIFKDDHSRYPKSVIEIIETTVKEILNNRLQNRKRVFPFPEETNHVPSSTSGSGKRNSWKIVRLE